MQTVWRGYSARIVREELADPIAVFQTQVFFAFMQSSLRVGAVVVGAPSLFCQPDFNFQPSLQMKLPATPLIRSDIGDGFGEVPAVTVKILSIVLALTIRMVLRLTQNDGAILPRSLAVPLGIFNANLNVL